MRFIVTTSARCSKCKRTFHYRSALDAETAEAARQKLLDNHRYCFGCSRFGIQAELDFDSRVKIEAGIKQSFSESSHITRTRDIGELLPRSRRFAGARNSSVAD